MSLTACSPCLLLFGMPPEKGVLPRDLEAGVSKAVATRAGQSQTGLPSGSASHPLSLQAQTWKSSSENASSSGIYKEKQAHSHQESGVPSCSLQGGVQTP